MQGSTTRDVRAGATRTFGTGDLCKRAELTRSRRPMNRPNALGLHRLGTIVASLLHVRSQTCGPAVIKSA